MFSKEAVQASEALKQIARNEQLKAYVKRSEDLYPLLLKAAKRFIAGETLEEGLSKASELQAKGYFFSLEYIGENIREIQECIRAKNQIMRLIEKVSPYSSKGAIALDLSHIGLSVDEGLAYQQLVGLSEAAKEAGLTIMISMEESKKTDSILNIYKSLSERYPNLGITLQAHLHRTIRDLHEILDVPGKIRIVKGAYREPSDIAMPRSEALNERYLQLVDKCAEAGRSLSIATHDEKLLQTVKARGYLSSDHVEIEMLYGIRPDISKRYKEEGYRTRIYLTYGEEWYLYLCHRLAEYPPNLYTAIVHMVYEDTENNNGY